jgi:hypothetical protein
VLSGTISGPQAVNVSAQPGSPLAAIYSDPYGEYPIEGSVIESDDQGNYEFWAPNGWYVLQIYGAGIYQVVNGVTEQQYLQGISLGSVLSSAQTPFSLLTSGINTQADMVVGDGASFSADGTGTIEATSLIPEPTIESATLSGETSVQTLNNVVYADAFTGADAFAQINAAIAALPSTGGTVDARGFGTSAQAVSTQLVIGSHTKPVCLIVDANTQFNISNTGGLPAIILHNKCSLVAFNSTNATNATFQLTASANVSSILTTEGSPGCICYIQGVTFASNASATVTDSLVDLEYVTDMSTIRNVLIWNFFGVGLHLNACSGPINLDNLSVNGLGNSGAQPVLITTESNAGSCYNINFIGGSYTHPGSGGLPIVWLKNVVANGANLSGITFYGTQFESTNSGDIGILIENATSIFGSGLTFTNAASAGTACIKLVQDAGGTVANIVLQSIFNQGVWTDTIDDTVNSITNTDAYVMSYKVAPSGSSDVIEQWVGSFGVYGLIAQLTTASLQVPELTLGAGGPTISTGAGAPSGSAVNGSLYINTSGAHSGPTLLYVYDTATTAWIPIA